MSFIAKARENAANTVMPQFEKRGMTAYYCKTKEEAAKKVLELMPKGASVTWGGSESMVQAGVIEAVKGGDYEVIDRHSAKTPEEARAIYGKIVCADFHLMSTNAFTRDGMLVNIDGASNRVACLAYGPKNVIVLASMNKMCENVESAIDRIRSLACPPNAIRVGANTPCAKTGVCADCLSPDCICDQIMITRMSRIKGRIIVVLCGEELGF